MDIAITALINGLIVLGVNALAHLLWRRQLEERDDSIRLLNDQLGEQKRVMRNINEDRLTRIEHDVSHAAGKRKEIYEYMRDNIVTKRDCSHVHDRESGDMHRLEKQLSIIFARLGEVEKTTQNASAVITLIAARLNITMGAAACPDAKGPATP